MPADASIYSMIRQPERVPGPLDQYAQALQLKSLMGQQELQGLQTQQARRGMEEEQRIRDLFSRGNVTPDEVMAVSPSRGLAYRKSLLEGEQAQAALDKTKIERFGAAAKQMRDIVASVRSDADMPMVREAAMRLFGPDIAAKMQIPERFDPAWQQKTVMTGDQLLERIMPKPPAGHSVKPDGTLSEIDPNYLEGRKKIAQAGRPQVSTTILPPQKTFENEDKLRADYTANPLVKSAAELQTAFGMIEAAYKRPSAANDLAMATKYMKILDPTSVVRESEFALAVNATGLMDKVLNYAAAVTEGKKLNPAQRKDFYESAKAINDAFQKQREEVDRQYSEMATGYGLNPKNVIPSLRKPKKPKDTPAEPLAPAGGAPTAPGKGAIKFLGFE